MTPNKDFFNYDDAVFEYVNCDSCGSDNYHILEEKSCDNRSATTCICKRCALIYINPRMTRDEYDKYYKFFYREDVIKRSGENRDMDIEKNFDSARKLGNAMAEKFKKYINNGLTIDVGSSTGGVLYGLREKIKDIDVVGIEPSLIESTHAIKKGIKTVNCLFENYKNEKKCGISNIFCSQSLNHLLSPMGFLRWSYFNLKEGGRLFLTVYDFRYQCRRSGGIIKNRVQIDHPFMFTPENLRLMLKKANFKILYEDVDEFKTKDEIEKQRKLGLTIRHIRIIAEKDSNLFQKDNKIINLWYYIKLRLQFSKPILRLHYIFFYSRYSILK